MSGKRIDKTPTPEAEAAAVVNGCAFIMLGHGKFALVDKEDKPLLECYSWVMHSGGYAVTSKSRRPLYMHRFITRCPEGMEVDHINHKILDNRKCNLRVCRTLDNRGNSKKTTRNDATSKFKGVSRCYRTGKWRARAKQDYKCLNLGVFNSQEAAASAYDAWAKLRFKEFAYTNGIQC